MTGFKPFAPNSCWQKTRAKNPRESSRRSISITNAPWSFVSVKIIELVLPSCSRSSVPLQLMGQHKPFSGGSLPVQLIIELSSFLQAVNGVDAEIPTPLHVVGRQSGS